MITTMFWSKLIKRDLPYNFILSQSTAIKAFQIEREIDFNLYFRSPVFSIFSQFTCPRAYRIRQLLLSRQVRAQQRQVHRPNRVHSVECWMLFDIVLQSVAVRKNPIGCWINSRIIIGPDRRVYHRRMCHRMHQQRIYYAVISVSTRPYLLTIG